MPIICNCLENDFYIKNYTHVGHQFDHFIIYLKKFIMQTEEPVSKIPFTYVGNLVVTM